jgi:hypothetical protein
VASRPVIPGYWRSLAERARSEASQLTDREAKMILLQIADAYERLALRAEGKTAGTARPSQKTT